MSYMVTNLQEYTAGLSFTLGCPQLCVIFLQYLVENFCEESLLFYMDVTVFRGQKDALQRRSKADVIYRTYIKPGSRHQINIDSDVRSVIESRLKESGTEAQRDLFDDAMCVVYSLLKTDSYPKFLKHTSFQAWLTAFNMLKGEKQNVRATQNGKNGATPETNPNNTTTPDSVPSFSLNPNINPKPVLFFIFTGRKTDLKQVASSSRKIRASLSNPEIPRDLRGKNPGTFNSLEQITHQCRVLWDFPVYVLVRLDNYLSDYLPRPTTDITAELERVTKACEYVHRMFDMIQIIEAGHNYAYEPNFFVEKITHESDLELAKKKTLYFSTVVLAIDDLVASSQNLKLLKFITEVAENTFFSFFYWNAPFQGVPSIKAPLELMIPPLKKDFKSSNKQKKRFFLA